MYVNVLYNNKVLNYMYVSTMYIIQMYMYMYICISQIQLQMYKSFNGSLHENLKPSPSLTCSWSRYPLRSWAWAGGVATSESCLSSRSIQSSRFCRYSRYSCMLPLLISSCCSLSLSSRWSLVHLDKMDDVRRFTYGI